MWRSVGGTQHTRGYGCQAKLGHSTRYVRLSGRYSSLGGPAGTGHCISQSKCSVNWEGRWHVLGMSARPRMRPHQLPPQISRATSLRTDPAVAQHASRFSRLEAHDHAFIHKDGDLHYVQKKASGHRWMDSAAAPLLKVAQTTQEKPHYNSSMLLLSSRFVKTRSEISCLLSSLSGRAEVPSCCASSPIGMPE